MRYLQMEGFMGVYQSKYIQVQMFDVNQVSL